MLRLAIVPFIRHANAFDRSGLQRSQMTNVCGLGMRSQTGQCHSRRELV